MLTLVESDEGYYYADIVRWLLSVAHLHWMDPAFSHLMHETKPLCLPVASSSDARLGGNMLLVLYYTGTGTTFSHRVNSENNKSKNLVFGTLTSMFFFCPAW